MISVCIPTFNGGKFIFEQLNTILSQLDDDDEVIISDDGSTDDTLNIIRSLHDRRVKIIHHIKNEVTSSYRYMLTTSNVEFAIGHAKGDYIYLADQDDIWLPGKVELVQSLLQKKTLICSDCTIIDVNGQEILSSYFKYNSSSRGFFKNLKRNSYLGCCMAFHRDLLPKILPITPMKVPHDIWIGLIAECYGSVHFECKPLVGYRRHDTNLSPSFGKSNNSLFFKISYRWLILSAIFLRLIKIK